MFGFDSASLGEPFAVEEVPGVHVLPEAENPGKMTSSGFRCYFGWCSGCPFGPTAGQGAYLDTHPSSVLFLRISRTSQKNLSGCVLSNRCPSAPSSGPVLRCCVPALRKESVPGRRL